MTDHIPEHFSDETVKVILARAIELDSRSPMTTVDELRAIAAEIGVSLNSLETALREQNITSEPKRGVAAERVATMVAGAGLPLGVVLGSVLTTMGFFGPLMASFATGAGLIATGVMIVLQGRTGTLRSFNIRNVALWGGMIAGSLAAIAVLGGAETTMPVLVTLVSCSRNWIASSLLGSAGLIAMRRARRPTNVDADGISAENVAGNPPRLWVRFAKRFVRWLGPVRRLRHPLRLTVLRPSLY